MEGTNEELRYGSSRFAEEWELNRAGLYKRKGPQIGFYRNKPLFLQGDAPLITIGGAGSGKLRDLLGYVVCNSPNQNMVVLDPRGELCAISHHVHAANNDYAYSWNPFGLHGLPQHSCNPLDILDINAPNFHALCKFVVEGLVAVSGSASGKYFELRARDYIEKIIKSIVELRGEVTLPILMQVLQMVEGDPELWIPHIEAMTMSRFDDVRRVAAEMLAKQEDSPKEFGAIMGEVYACMSFLEDPVLCQSLEKSDFSLKELCDKGHGTKIFLNIPAEYLNLWSPLVRLFFTVSMLYKAADPSANRVMLLVDEAGQLGRFDALLRAFTFGRGAGIRAWAIFQDIGQIIRNFDMATVSGFLGSAQMRQFFGVRDHQTAQIISDMLGTETLTYDNVKLQAELKHKKSQAAQNILNGGDPFADIMNIAREASAADVKLKQSRKLMTPSEILSLPEDQQLIFISGKDIPPILANKYPYYQRPEMAGLFLPNPYHPPIDHVPVPKHFGSKTAKIIREPVPRKYASFPQYQDGSWAYVEGYKPT